MISINKKDKTQIDIMINEGLGAGKIDNKHDKEQLNSPKSKEPKVIKNTMVERFSDAKALGKEMEAIETNKEVKENGKIPDPIQNSK